jgi:5-methyltetrahydrofolate--homocysteine methyltransferase
MRLRDRIASGEILIGDGAIGTALQRRGLPVGTAPETWTLDHPEEVKQVAADYFRVGSDFVLTNTFGGNRIRLGAAGLGDEVDQVNSRSVALARSVAPDSAYVVASVGPTGKVLTEEEYGDVYAEQAVVLIGAGVDGFCVETVCSSTEGFAAVGVIRQLSDLPVVLTFALKWSHSMLATISGEPFNDVVSRAKDLGVDVLGANCVGWELLGDAVECLARVSGLPIAISPNAGVPDLIEGRVDYRESEEDLAERVASVGSWRVRILGGCCGTGPVYVEALRKLVDQKPIVK